jgi:hypothetical protein
MVLASLRAALDAIRRFPQLWILGAVSGMVGAITLLSQLLGGSFYAERLGILQLVLLPFFISGGLFLIHTGKGGFEKFIEGGKRFYWRILLATVVILFASLTMMILLVFSLALIGIPADSSLLSMILLGVLVPIAFFTFFYDTAIVFEDRKTLDSLRRSVEFVLTNGFRVFLFILVNLFIFGIIAFGSLVLWAALLAEKLEPLVAQNLSLDQNLAPEAFLSVLGPEGSVITAILYFLAVSITVTILYAYKGCFYRQYTSSLPMQTGEVDEKGRWYKY